MAQAAVVLRRNHEKRRREQEQRADRAVTLHPVYDTPGAGRSGTPDATQNSILAYVDATDSNARHLQSPDKDCWVGLYSTVVFSIYTCE